ncbi:hypothetical protein JZ751_000556 [Albula glossodonta]|uniref:Uncharacterized protein n=1 Tax=Albula glossodonta TaxID=121402 RepID=A0A8T2PWQ8_9TELE|nr:hypothetical protein JZ751_000556 [Albula glossodonta]
MEGGPWDNRTVLVSVVWSRSFYDQVMFGLAKAELNRAVHSGSLRASFSGCLNKEAAVTWVGERSWIAPVRTRKATPTVGAVTGGHVAVLSTHLIN